MPDAVKNVQIFHPHKKIRKVKMPDFKKRIEARFGDRTLKPKDVEWLDEAMRSRL
jgi:hypothetical protein